MPITDAGEAPTKLGNFLRSVKQMTGTDKSTSMLNPCAFLCDLKNGMSEILALSAAAQDRAYGYRILFFDKEPPFIISRAP